MLGNWVPLRFFFGWTQGLPFYRPKICLRTRGCPFIEPKFAPSTRGCHFIEPKCAFEASPEAEPTLRVPMVISMGIYTETSMGIFMKISRGISMKISMGISMAIPMDTYITSCRYPMVFEKRALKGGNGGPQALGALRPREHRE